MNAGAIILLIAVIGVCVFEVGSLIATIVKKKKNSKKQGAVQEEKSAENNDNDKEVSK